MTVEVAPITDAHVAAVADFLHANLNDRVPWELACSAVPWKVEAPNHRFMLRDGSASSGHDWLSTPSGSWQDGWSGSAT